MERKENEVGTEKKPENPDEATRKEQDDYLEEALEETFPASDPISPGKVKDHSQPTKPAPPGTTDTIATFTETDTSP